MVAFSIELITRGEKTTKAVIESALRQTMDSYEIVCFNSSSDSSTAKMLDDYGIEHIDGNPNVKALEARYRANSLSDGEFSLLLDSTRPLSPDALEKMQTYASESIDMLAFREESIGNGFWINQVRLYKELTENEQNVKTFSERRASFILPRLYRQNIIKQAFSNLKTLIPWDVFRKVSYGEHHIIFEESLKLSSRVSFVGNEALIFHYEDPSFFSIWRKYYYYGSTQKVLKNLQTYNASKLASHRRVVRVKDLSHEIQCLPIILVRTIPFVLGMLKSTRRS